MAYSRILWQVSDKVRFLIRFGDCEEIIASDRIKWQVTGKYKVSIIIIGKWPVNMSSVIIIWKVTGNIWFTVKGKNKSSSKIRRVTGKYWEWQDNMASDGIAQGYCSILVGGRI